jgi:antitoxin (DNA-binding transcriptional repressor) of toxin-antitoxin stability system
MRSITIAEAAKRLEELVAELQPGEEIRLTANDRAVARIVPESSAPRHRKAGAWKGKLRIVHDDDSHLEDFKEWM